jgi:hypothetical protein
MNAVALITNKVGGIVVSELFEDTMTYLHITYGGDSDITYVEIQRPLDTCPKVKTIPEADLFVTLVSETDLDLGTLGSHRSLKEPYKCSLCLQKMGDLFNPLLQQISGGGPTNLPPWTFAQMTVAIYQMKGMARIRATNVTADTPFQDASLMGVSSSLVKRTVKEEDGHKEDGHMLRDCDKCCMLCGTKRDHHASNYCPEHLQRRKAFSPTPVNKKRDAGRSNIYRQATSPPTKRVVNEVQGQFIPDDFEDELLDYIPR